MERKAKSGIMLTLLLISMVTLAFNIQPINSTWPWPSPPPIEWNKTYGGPYDGASGFQQTTDGGYIIAGTETSMDYLTSDVWLVKTDSCGNMQWNKTYSVDDVDEGWSVALTGDGGYILAGCTRPVGGLESALLIKTDSYGNLQWNKTYRVAVWNYIWSVIQASDGGYIFVGTATYYIEPWGYNPSYLWLAKVDDSGNMQWDKKWDYGGGSMAWSFGRQIIQTSDGQYAVLGETSVPGTGDDFWLIKVGDSGNMLWNKTYGWPGGSWEDGACSIAQTSDGGYILAGTCKGTGGSYPDGWLIKTDDGGNVQWNSTYGAGGTDSIGCVIQTNDGGYIFGGFFWPGYGDAQAWFVKTDDSGELQWAGRDENYGNVIADIKQTSDYGYIMLHNTGYPYYLTSLMKLKGLAHDVAITNAAPSKTVVGQGYSLNINVTAANQGDYTETFNVTAYADLNTTIIGDEITVGTQNVTLSNGNSTTITFTWNTTGVAKGNHTVTAEAAQLPGETDIDDNTRTDGWVIVTWLGDVTSETQPGVPDYIVDQFDYWYFCSAFIDYYKIHVKDPNCDFDCNCIINQLDYWTFCGGYIDYYNA